MRKFVLLFAMLFASNIALAESNAEKAAAELLMVVGLEQAFNETIDQMLAVELQQNPTLMPFKGVMKEFFQKYMSYESLKPELVALYSETFSAKELGEIAAFYKTPTGRKTIAVMPELMARGAQIGVSRVQSNLGELQEMIRAESERLNALQQR